MVTCLLHNCSQISKLPLQWFVTSSSPKKVWWPNQKDLICWNKQTNDVSCKYLLSIFKMCYIAIRNKSHSVENFFWKGVHCWLFEVKVSFQSRPCWRQNVSLLTWLEMRFSHKRREKENNFYGLDKCLLKSKLLS